jgi:type I restriction enzyme S subunit
MAKYQAYPEYKDSGVEWIGEIPYHWCVSKVKFLTSFQVGWTPPTKDEANFEGENLWANISDLRHREIFDTNKKISDDAVKAASMDVSPAGSLLYSFKLSVGTVSFAGKDMYTNEAIATFLSASRLPLSYLYYVLPQFVIENASTNIYGARILNQELIRDAFLLSPTYDEASKIANFLDHETAKIDTLIEKQQQLIQLLKEKRQAVISHAVTKGLNPNAPMKDSGVEWLGQVPEHWEVKQAKYVADITRGAILRPVDAPEYFDEEGEWAYLNISDATACKKYLYESKLRLSELGSTKSARVYPNNLIVTASATIGKAFINKIKVCVHDGFIPFCRIKMDIDYLYHYISNPFLYAAMGKSNTQKNIYLDEVKNMIITVPPREEQQAIVKYLESNSDNFDVLIERAEQAIQLMQERRIALISAAVTGKIDVRN